MLGAVPLYGICTNCRPAIRLSSSIVRCWPLPVPEDEKSISSGCFLVNAIKSFTVFTGSEGCTANMLGDCTNSETGVKSVSVS